MKVLFQILAFFFSVQVFGQMPKNLIVAAENLNFRNAPSTKSKVIDQLENSELLETIELVKKKKIGIYNYDFGRSWIKVRRKMTGEIGFVFGKYVLPENIAYRNFSDCERMQTGFWYGIFEKKGKTYFKQITPKIRIEKDDAMAQEYSSIVSEDDSRFIFCSQKKLEPDQFSGKIFKDYGKNASIPFGGEKAYSLSANEKLLFESKGILEGEYSSLQDRKENERILIDYLSNGKKTAFDISKDILKFGDCCYYLHFAGDLNNDGIPELFLSEGTTHGGAFYFFMSNANGELELQSIAWSSSKC